MINFKDMKRGIGGLSDQVKSQIYGNKEEKSGPVAEQEIAKRSNLHEQVRKEKKKGYVQLLTNMGGFTIQLHCDITPIACDNFIRLCESNYFNDQTFHRLIPNFMIQGGDPTGSGRGGQSFFGGPFPDEFDGRLKHDSPGVVSMANSGKRDDNKSQFFITFAPCPHLDNKHTVFGKVVGGLDEFMRLNTAATNSSDIPLEPIRIERTVVVEDPFTDVIKAKDEKLKREAENQKQAVYLKLARTDPMAHHPNRNSTDIGKYIDWTDFENKFRR
jgi:peptidyl-prolyl cis-trans isomerase-like protein 2